MDLVTMRFGIYMLSLYLDFYPDTWVHVFGLLRIQITLHYFVGVGNFKIFSLGSVSKIAILLQKFNLYEYTMESYGSIS